jgi:hypothetical protein
LRRPRHATSLTPAAPSRRRKCGKRPGKMRRHGKMRFRINDKMIIFAGIFFIHLSLSEFENYVG